MIMHNPPHPGEVIREFCIEPLGLSSGSDVIRTTTPPDCKAIV